MDKSNQNEQTGSFISFILVDECKLDFELLKKQLQEDWDIKINDEDFTEDSQSLVVAISDMNIVVSLMPAPVPNNEAVENAETNFRWDEAVEVAKNHKAHILISLLGGKEKLLDATNIFVKFCSSCLKQPNATAINTLGTVIDPEFYIDFAEESLKNDEFPLMNMVFFGVYSLDNGATISAYTYGLRVFGKKDMEILNSDKSVDEVFNLLSNITLYIITSDITLKNNETIGFSEEQKLKITFLDSNVLDEETLKIDF